VKNWDAFISHASEDHDLVRDLAERFRKAGLRIWLDQHELRLGDSLSEKIDEGLAASRFGIVVLSPSFVAKRWPRQELNGLMAREEGGGKVILPVWHEIGKETLATYSPMLADRLAVNTEDGIAQVVASIVEVIVDPKNGSPAVEMPTIAGRFISTLASASPPGAIRDFLLAHPRVMGQALGIRGRQRDLRGAVSLGSFELDLCVSLDVGATTRTHTWVIVQLESPSQPLFADAVAPVAEVERRVGELEAFRRWASQNLVAVDGLLPRFGTTFKAVVVAGRRVLLSDDARDGLRLYNEKLGITLRTYDWLLDAAASLE
jgi:TIR domain